MKGIDYVTETNTYRAFSPFNTPIEKLVFALSGTRTLVSPIRDPHAAKSPRYSAALPAW